LFDNHAYTENFSVLLFLVTQKELGVSKFNLEGTLLPLQLEKKASGKWKYPKRVSNESTSLHHTMNL